MSYRRRARRPWHLGHPAVRAHMRRARLGTLRWMAITDDDRKYIAMHDAFTTHILCSFRITHL